MIALTSFDWIKTTHVLAVVIWVGGGFTINVLATIALRSWQVSERATFGLTIKKVGDMVFIPASLMALGTGLWMVMGFDNRGLEFEDPWVSIGLIGFASTFLTGLFLLGPTAGKWGAALAAGDPNAEAIERRLYTISRFDLVVLLTVVGVMVLKPGA